MLGVGLDLVLVLWTCLATPVMLVGGRRVRMPKPSLSFSVKLLVCPLCFILSLLSSTFVLILSDGHSSTSFQKLLK